MKRQEPPSPSNKPADGALECPCCGAKLHYDPLKRSLRSAAAGAPGKDLSFEEAVSALRAEKDRADEKFRAAFEQEGKRKASLTQKFEESLKNAEESDERPIRPFDYD